MFPPTMNFNRSSSYFRYEKDHSNPLSSFPRVMPAASDSTESDFSPVYSLFASVNDLRLQDIAVKVSSTISSSADSYINLNTITPSYENMQKKNLIVTAQTVDGQVYSFLNEGAACMKLIEGFREDPCIWESKRKTWKMAMGRMRNPQPFIAFPKDLPVISHPQLILDSPRVDYIPLIPGPGEIHFEKHKHLPRKSATGDGYLEALSKAQVLDYPYELQLSSEHYLKANPVGNENLMGIGNLSINRRTYIDDYESVDDVDCSSSDDHNFSSSDDDNSSSSDDDSAEMDDYASDEDFFPSEPTSWLSMVMSIPSNI